jgi:L-rhamnose mutarotase
MIKNYSIFINQKNNRDIDVFIVIKSIDEDIRT